MASIWPRVMWPAIRWYCQNCGYYWMTTIHHDPYGIGDPDCEDCMVGSTMTAVGKCAECDHEFEYNKKPCIHFEKYYEEDAPRMEFLKKRSEEMMAQYKLRHK